MDIPQQRQAIASLRDTLAAHRPAADRLERVAVDASVIGVVNKEIVDEARHLGEVATSLLESARSAAAGNRDDNELTALLLQVTGFHKQVEVALAQLVQLPPR